MQISKYTAELQWFLIQHFSRVPVSVILGTLRLCSCRLPQYPPACHSARMPMPFLSVREPSGAQTQAAVTEPTRLFLSQDTSKRHLLFLRSVFVLSLLVSLEIRFSLAVLGTVISVQRSQYFTDDAASKSRSRCTVVIKFNH